MPPIYLLELLIPNSFSLDQISYCEDIFYWVDEPAPQGTFSSKDNSIKLMRSPISYDIQHYLQDSSCYSSLILSGDQIRCLNWNGAEAVIVRNDWIKLLKSIYSVTNQFSVAKRDDEDDPVEKMDVTFDYLCNSFWNIKGNVLLSIKESTQGRSLQDHTG